MNITKQQVGEQEHKAPGFRNWYSLNDSDLKESFIRDNYSDFIGFCVDEYMNKFGGLKK